MFLCVVFEMLTKLILIFIFNLFFVAINVHANHFANEWAVHIDGDDVIADQIAAENGFINHGAVSHVIFI